MPQPLPENRLYLVKGNRILMRHKQRESVRKKSSKTNDNNVNSENSIKTPPVLDRGHFEIEKKHYDNHISLTSYSNSLLSNTVNQNDVQQIEFTIDSRINIWDQHKTASCSAHATCFLYTYIMAFKGVDWSDFAQCNQDIQCIGNAFLNSQAFNSTLRPLTLKLGYDMWLNFDNNFFRVSYDDIDGYFSRLFVMWSAYYTPLGSYDYNIQTTVSPSPPVVSEGTWIISALVGLQTWGCVPLLANNVGFTFKQFSENFSDTIINTTTAAFNGPVERSTIDNLTKNDLDSKVTAFNASFNPYWSIQKKNNFKIVTVPQEPSVIISVLNQGYPVTVSMTIINLDLDGAFGIPLVTQDGLNNVLQYTDKSQTQNNIPLSTHAVIAVGYTNKTTSGNYYIKIRNSWSTKFGDNGYFYMPISFFINPEYCTALYTIALSGIDVINIPGVITTPTTTTVYDWRNLKIGETKVFTTNNGSLYKINDSIFIFYSVKDSITGEITNINGNDITISITTFTSNAAYTTLNTLINVPPDVPLAGSQTDVTFTLGRSLGVNSIITGGQCYLYSVQETPLQIDITAAGRPVFSTDPQYPLQTKPVQLAYTLSDFTLVEGCFVEKTETPQIRAISTTGVRFDWGFNSQGPGYRVFAGVLSGYTLPYEVGVISIIS
jgi:hypothetical protein